MACRKVGNPNKSGRLQQLRGERPRLGIYGNHFRKGSRRRRGVAIHQLFDLYGDAVSGLAPGVEFLGAVHKAALEDRKKFGRRVINYELGL